MKSFKTCVRFSEVRPHQPLCPGEGVVEVLLGGVVLVGRSPVVLADELEEPRPLVLPHGGRAGAADHDPVTVRVAGEGLQQVPGPGLLHCPEVLAVLVADVALLPLRGPGPAGHHVAPVPPFLHCREVLDAVERALGLAGVPGTGHGSEQ